MIFTDIIEFLVQAQPAFASTFLPEAATSLAKEVDHLYKFLVIASFISCVLVIGGMIYFALKYKRKTDNDDTPYISHNTFLEFLWSFVPFVIFMFVFAWGAIIFFKMEKAPKESMEIHVTGFQWGWNFTYKNGRTEGSEFVVPINTPVKLIMRSTDVLHSFFVPAFRVKQDVVPGRYTTLWFEANKLGTYNVFCTEYCGEKHSAMLAKLKVVTVDEYQQWLVDDPKYLPMAERGARILNGQCVACHNIDSDVKKIGPGFKGLWGKTREFESGKSVVVDGDYIRESILYPGANIVKGYKNQMNSFASLLKDEEIDAIIEYFKTQAEAQ